MSKQIS